MKITSQPPRSKRIRMMISSSRIRRNKVNLVRNHRQSAMQDSTRRQSEIRKIAIVAVLPRRLRRRAVLGAALPLFRRSPLRDMARRRTRQGVVTVVPGQNRICLHLDPLRVAGSPTEMMRQQKEVPGLLLPQRRENRQKTGSIRCNLEVLPLLRLENRTTTGQVGALILSISIGASHPADLIVGESLCWSFQERGRVALGARRLRGTMMTMTTVMKHQLAPAMETPRHQQQPPQGLPERDTAKDYPAYPWTMMTLLLAMLSLHPAPPLTQCMRVIASYRPLQVATTTTCPIMQILAGIMTTEQDILNLVIISRLTCSSVNIVPHLHLLI
mmetsp:Transcript_7150/g.15879  ORF Transcript_7150/g.15879 Transcript_7150/m.15879 type:complete len:329 (-) Transcript_7150:697-1683(-)